MEYMPQVRISKEDFLALSDLAGDMSIMDYMSKVIRDHVAAQQSVHRTDGRVCDCGVDSDPKKFGTHHSHDCPVIR